MKLQPNKLNEYKKWAENQNWFNKECVTIKATPSQEELNILENKLSYPNNYQKILKKCWRSAAY